MVALKHSEMTRVQRMVLRRQLFECSVVLIVTLGSIHREAQRMPYGYIKVKLIVSHFENPPPRV